MKRSGILSSTVTSTVLATAFVSLAAASAQAQLSDPLAPPPATPTGSAPAGSAFGGAGPTAGRGFAIGAEQMLGPAPIGGVAVAYDLGDFHLDGLFGAADGGEGRATNLGVAARFWYHLHTAASADFSVGGGVGLLHLGDDDGDDDQNAVNIEAGAQIRAFIVPNVAITGSAGLGLLTGDGDGFIVGGHLLGSLGFLYFFQ